MVLDSIN